jgi:hypothetical protein
MFEFELELIDNIYFTICFNVKKEITVSFFDPGVPAEIEITDIKFYGESLSNIQCNSFIEDYGEVDLEEWCWEQLRTLEQDGNY